MNIRGRLLLALLVAVAVAAAGMVSERVLGTQNPRPVGAVGEASGGWLCPHGGGEGYRAWVVAVNPSERPADLRLTSYAPEASRPVREVLPARSQDYFEVPAGAPAAATLLEFFGPPVAASMVTLRGPGEGLAAEPCAASAARRWFVTDGTTVRGQAETIVAMNPFAQEAVIEVTLHTEDRVIHHSNLRVVVDPGRVVSFDVNRFALGEEVVLADVRVALGKVAVAGLGMGTDSGLRMTLGVSEPATSWVLPAAADARPARVRVLGTGIEEAPFQVLVQGDDGSKVVLEEQEVSPRAVEDLRIPGGPGIVVQGGGRVPFAVGRTLAPAGGAPTQPDGGGGPDDQGGGGKNDGGGQAPGGKGKEEDEAAPEPEATDLASTAGAAQTASTWIAPSPLPPAGGDAVLVLQNPGGSSALGEVALVAEDGSIGSPLPVTVEPGRTSVVDLAAEAGQQPVAAVVRLSTGNVVVAQVATDPDGYAVSTGIPVDPGP